MHLKINYFDFEFKEKILILIFACILYYETHHNFRKISCLLGHSGNATPRKKKKSWNYPTALQWGGLDPSICNPTVLLNFGVICQPVPEKPNVYQVVRFNWIIVNNFSEHLQIFILIISLSSTTTKHYVNLSHYWDFPDCIHSNQLYQTQTVFIKTIHWFTIHTITVTRTVAIQTEIR